MATRPKTPSPAGAAPTPPTRSVPPAAPGEQGVEVRLPLFLEPSVLEELPLELARRYAVLPLGRAGDALVVAADGGLSRSRLRGLARELGTPVRAVPAELPELEVALRCLYADREVSSRPKRLGQVLVELGFITGKQLGAALAQQARANNPSFAPALRVDRELLELVPEALARRFRVLPLCRTDRSLLLATCERLGDAALAEIGRQTGLEPRAVTVGPEELTLAIARCYRARQPQDAGGARLGELLVSRGLVSQEQLERCLEQQRSDPARLGELAVTAGLVTEDALYPVLAEKLGLEYRHLEPGRVDHQLGHLLSQRFAERNLVLPIELEQKDGTLVVALSDPNNLQVRDVLQTVAETNGYRLKLVLAAPGRLRECIGHTYELSRRLDTEVEELEIEADAEEEGWESQVDRLELVPSEDLPRIRRVINKLLLEAVTEGASDIHIENLEARTQVRLRIDGILQERATPINKANIRKVISVLKVVSGLDIAERRRAQDGVFRMRIGKERVIDFRINVHATEFGEDAVIRILDRSRGLLALSELGFAPEVLERYEALVGNPQGLVLITGPTGSGKTTTLYSTLTYLNTGDKKIVTAEDPVEYHLDGVTQYQVNNLIGNTFAEYTRRFLRKDPDIILVGEIRDRETARACIDAAMTGHLVFSTLHTNDAIGVVPRLRDLGIDSSALADALLAVLSQRLARRNCPHCRRPYQPEAGLLREFFPEGEIPAEARFVRGIGCAHCGGQGMKGRVGLYEFWELRRGTRQAIAARAEEAVVRRSALDGGLVPLLEDALRKVYDGTTKLEELRRVVPLEQIRSYIDARR